MDGRSAKKHGARRALVELDSIGGREMKGRRETLVVATAAVLFGVVFSILFLACGQREDEPGARADAPASAKVEAPRPGANFDDIMTQVQNLGRRIQRAGGKATGDLGVTLEKLEAEQARLKAELETIGGQNAKWDAARTELIGNTHRLRERVKKFEASVNE
jgi:hypothetical protein